MIWSQRPPQDAQIFGCPDHPAAKPARLDSKHGQI
jgi:hypothetical protein